MTFISYAQNYEDVMLARALRGIEQGFYVDVGAQDPIEHSVTKAFYMLGWSGINIEPVTHWYGKLLADRPRDTNLQLAASEGRGELHLFEIDNTGLSTTNPEFAKRHAQAGFDVRETNVECATLDQICEEQGAGAVHFLKIDCEGAEVAVLRGCSLDRVRPWIILVEATEPLRQESTYAEWEPLLTGRGYHFVYADGLNRFYVADEHAELDHAFSSPPNVFDDFVRASEAAAHQELRTLRGEFAALRHNVGFLHDENERREAALVEQRRALNEFAERESFMRGELNRYQTEILRRDREVARLNVEVVRSTHEMGRLHQEVADLQSSIHAFHRSTSWRVTYPLRFAKRGVVKTTTAASHILWFVLRWPARIARPLLRRMAQWAWLRSVAVRMIGSESRLAKAASLFLFGGLPGAPANAAKPDNHLAMTRRAARIYAEIRDVQSKQGGGDASGDK